MKHAGTVLYLPAFAVSKEEIFYGEQRAEMKLANRISTVAAVVFFSMGTAGALILLHGCADFHLLFSPRRWFSDFHAVIPFLAMSFLFLGALVMISWLLYFINHVVRRLRRAEDFIREILAGSMPQPLSMRGIRDEEIISLFSTLNFMRDRQQNLSERLRWQRESEEKLRREIEYFDDLQIAAFSRLLREMRRSAGVVKAYTLIELARARKNSKAAESNTADENEAMLLSSLKRQSRMSRELDFLSDVAKLERKRWSSPLTDRFAALPLIKELTDRCQISLQTRKISLVCHYLSGIPELLACDRELLYHLLHLMIRSTTRSLTGGACVTLTVSGRHNRAVFEISDRRQDEHRELLAENYQLFRNADTEHAPDTADFSLSIIGLEIVRTIAEKIGCSLEVESTEQNATILRMIVPGAEIKKQSSMEDNPLRLPRDTVSAEPAGEIPERALDIYLSDDDPEEAEAFKQIFRHENIDISVYPDNSSLLDAAAIQRGIDGAMIAAPFRQGQAAKNIALIRKVTGRNTLPILVITPVHKRELASELASIPNVWLLESPLNFAQAAELLKRHTVRDGR